MDMMIIFKYISYSDSPHTEGEDVSESGDGDTGCGVPESSAHPDLHSLLSRYLV